MSKHRLINITLAAVIAAVLSLSYLLDGPSELDAMRAIQADLWMRKRWGRSSERLHQA